MAKTQEELNELKKEYETLTNKLKELTEDELKQVAGGMHVNCYDTCHFDPPKFSGICEDCPYYIQASLRGNCRY